MKRLRIGFFISQLGGGGAERVVANLSNRFAALGHSVRVITTFRAEDEYPLDPSVRRYVLREITEDGFSGTFRRIRALRRICREEALDVLVALNGNAPYHGILATAGLPVKSVISVRNDPASIYRGALSRFLARTLLPFADGCVFQTEDARDWFPKRLRRKSAILFNPVNEKFYQRAYTPVPGRVVTLGRLAAEKNHRLLLDAFQILLNRNPEQNWELRVYGEGDLHDALARQIGELGLTEKVRLMGRTDAAPEVLSHAALFVLSSDFEGLPNALMEAMAAGVPCVSTDCPCGGPGTLLRDGGGKLVPTGDASALASGMEELLLDAESRERCSREAKRTAERFTQERVCDDWLRYLKQVAHKGGTDP